jgi:Kef-type K+ transport system membrane component KefB
VTNPKNTRVPNLIECRTFLAGLEARLNELGNPHLAGWWTGLIIGLVVVVVVVVLVSVLLVLAARINAHVRAAIRELEATRPNTQPLGELSRTNDTLQRILRGARTARQALGG